MNRFYYGHWTLKLLKENYRPKLDCGFYINGNHFLKQLKLDLDNFWNINLIPIVCVYLKDIIMSFLYGGLKFSWPYELLFLCFYWTSSNDQHLKVSHILSLLSLLISTFTSVKLIIYRVDDGITSHVTEFFNGLHILYSLNTWEKIF